MIDVYVWIGVAAFTLLLSMIVNVCSNARSSQFDHSAKKYMKNKGFYITLGIFFVVSVVIAYVITVILMTGYFLSTLDANVFPGEDAETSGEWETTQIDFEDVDFYDGDVLLNGWFIRCTIIGPCIPMLYCHGSGANIAAQYRIDRYEIWTSLGYEVFVFDYPSYGRSEGVISEDTLYTSTFAALDWLKNKTFSSNNDIVVLGRSLGTVPATKVASDLSPRGLILQSGWAKYSDALSLSLPVTGWFVYLASGLELNNIDDIPSFEGPFIQYHSPADEWVPYSSAQALFEAATTEDATFVSVEDQKHDDPMSSEEIAAHLEWRIDHFF